MRWLMLIPRAVMTVLRSGKNWRIAFTLISGLLFSAYLFLPVWLTPGNDLAFQLSILLPRDYVMFGALSMTTALLVLMQVFVSRRKRETKSALLAVGGSGVGVGSAIFGGLLATAACTSCVAALIGFLGAGSVFFVLKNQWAFVAGALFLVFAGLFYSARRVEGYCADCEVPFGGGNNA